MQPQTKTNEKGVAAPVQARGAEIPVREKQSLEREPGTHQGQYFEPPVDIFETEEALVVRADLPGVKVEDVQTTLRDNLLVISATVQSLQEGWRQVYGEYRVGHFIRQFRLGQQIDQGKISAEMKDGVLTLTLPKADHARPRRIEIRHAG
jgi:HSP20 family molecular chaperone IbpA